MTITYTCGAGQTAPALPFSLTVTNAAPFFAGTPTETTTVSAVPTAGHAHRDDHGNRLGACGCLDGGKLYRYDDVLVW